MSKHYQKLFEEVFSEHSLVIAQLFLLVLREAHTSTVQAQHKCVSIAYHTHDGPHFIKCLIVSAGTS